MLCSRWCYYFVFKIVTLIFVCHRQFGDYWSYWIIRLLDCYEVKDDSTLFTIFTQRYSNYFVLECQLAW